MNHTEKLSEMTGCIYLADEFGVCCKDNPHGIKDKKCTKFCHGCPDQLSIEDVEALEQERDKIDDERRSAWSLYDDARKRAESAEAKLKDAEVWREKWKDEAQLKIERLEKSEAEVEELEELLDMKVAQPLKTIEALESRLVKAQELVEKWRRVEVLANAEQVAIKMAHHKCADELDDALK